MNLEELPFREVRLLIGLLLTDRGFKVESEQNIQIGQTIRVGRTDYVAISGGKRFLVEIKYSEHAEPLPYSICRRFATDALNLGAATNADGVVLVILNVVSQYAVAQLGMEDGIQIWDKTVILQWLSSRADVKAKLDEMVVLRESLTTHEQSLVQMRYRREHKDDSTVTEVDLMITALRAVPRGKDGWREFEDRALTVLNFVFVPPLPPPKIQSRSDDGLDIRDAIWPIRENSGTWGQIQRECRTRFVVAEFKNYSEPVDQQAVEQTRRYLYADAMRTFGIICSRHPPSVSATLARRRSWLEEKKLMVFLFDDDLEFMARRKQAQEEPSVVIDAQVEEFLSTLTP